MNYDDKIRAREWVECDEKPFICIDADGDHLNVPNGILYGCRLSDPRRIRRARFGRWLNKHPIVGECARWFAIAACCGWIALTWLMVAGALYSAASAVKEALNTEVVDE
jgi:hypothetical protein